MAKEWSCRPSEILAVADPVTAFCFDRAVYLFGTALSSELENVKAKTDKERKNKQDRILSKWIPEAKARQKSKFKDPASRQG
jgi:hypothetical protein